MSVDGNRKNHDSRRSKSPPPLRFEASLRPRTQPREEREKMASYEETLAKIFEERLRNFYKKYDASKLDTVESLAVKYKGNEEKLLRAMVGKYGPEPTAEELDDNDDNDDDDDDEETAEGTAEAKSPAVDEKKDAIDDDEEDEEDDDDDDPHYCGVCGLPAEYCEYSENYDKCLPWIEKNCPHLLKEDRDDDDAAKKKKKRGGGVLKKKELADDKMKVILYTETRSRKKIVTVVDGLETLGVKLKDAAKIFGKKFASSSSVKEKDSGGSEIVIQGDVIYDLPDLLKHEFKVPNSKLFTKGDKGAIVPLLR